MQVLTRINEFRTFFDKFAVQEGLKNWEDWYRSSHLKILLKEKGGVGAEALRFFDDSLPRAITSIYPEHPWQAWKFESQPTPRFWSVMRNQRDALDSFGKQLGLKNMEDWYQVSNKQFIQSGLTPLMKEHGNSHIKALMSVYPEYGWKMWKFNAVSTGFWNDTANQLDFLNQFAKDMKLKSMDDWYQVTASDIRDYGGASLLEKYSSNPGRMLQALFKNHDWHFWKFHEGSHPFWENMEYQRRYLDWLAKELGYVATEDWYKIRPEDIIQRDGKKLLKIYDDYVHLCLMACYPEFSWEVWRFRNFQPWRQVGVEDVADYFWDNADNVRLVLKWTENRLSMTKPEDWYDISVNQLYQLGLSTMLTKFGGLSNVLCMFYPDYPWDFEGKKSNFKAEAVLFKTLQEYFPPNMNIHSKFAHPDMKFSEGRSMEMDVYIPDAKLAFEYQGIQHFQQHAFIEYKIENDKEKRQACSDLGITLIEVPYWWDELPESLLMTIDRRRPDLAASGILSHSTISSLRSRKVAPIPDQPKLRGRARVPKRTLI